MNNQDHSHQFYDFHKNTVKGQGEREEWREQQTVRQKKRKKKQLQPLKWVKDTLIANT